MSHFSSVCYDSGEDARWRHRRVDLLSGEERGVSARESGYCELRYYAIVPITAHSEAKRATQVSTGVRFLKTYLPWQTRVSARLWIQFGKCSRWRDRLLFNCVHQMSSRSPSRQVPARSTVASTSRSWRMKVRWKVKALLSAASPDGYGCLCSSLHMWRCYVDVSVRFSIRGTWGLLSHQTVTRVHVLDSERDCFNFNILTLSDPVRNAFGFFCVKNVIEDIQVNACFILVVIFRSEPSLRCVSPSRNESIF